MKIEGVSDDVEIKITLTEQERKWLVADLQQFDDEIGISWAVTGELLDFLRELRA